MLRKLLLLSSLSVFSICAFAQHDEKQKEPEPTSGPSKVKEDPPRFKRSFEIKARIVGMPKDSVAYLAHYYGERNVVKDTAKADAKGNLVFKGNKDFPSGIYLIVLHNHRYMEVVINKSTKFSLETDTADFVRNMKVTGNDEMRQFYDYLIMLNEKEREARPYSDALRKIKDTKKHKDSVDMLRKKLEDIGKSIKTYKTDYMAKNPTSFVAKIFKYTDEIDIPETPTLPNGRKDSTFAYRYYKAHYFDNLDFTDERMIYTPILINKMKYWLDQMTQQTPDSISQAAFVWLEKARANRELFKYSLAWMTYHYETSKIMGQEAVFVDLVQRYYATNEVWWVDSVQLYKIVDRANKLAPIMIGKKARNMILTDTLGVPHSMMDIPAKYTILFFYDPDCGHCRKSTPDLVKAYTNLKKEFPILVYAVSVEVEVEKWKKFIREFKTGEFMNVADPQYTDTVFRSYYDVSTTPQLLILNEKKEIVARKLGTDQIEEFIHNYDKAMGGSKKKS